MELLPVAIDVSADQPDRVKNAGMAFRSLASTTKTQRRTYITWSTILTILLCLSGGCYFILSLSCWSLFGVFLLAEGMILSWYLRHDCCHLLAFQRKKHNVVLGEILSCITGELQSPFTEYRRAHLRHHSDQVDLVGVDLHHMLESYPRWARSAVLLLESAYIPIIFLLVRVANIWSELNASGGSRVRAVCAIAIYSLVYGTVGALSPVSLLLYLFAVIIRIHCLRFVDAYQHTYHRVSGDGQIKSQGWTYEQRNTFSFPIAKNYTFLNLLILNFGFHNAHHASPTCPWYRLPKLDKALRQSWQLSDQEIRDPSPRGQIGIGLLLKSYHRDRVRRITDSDSGMAYGLNDRFSMEAFRGAFTDNLLG